MENNELIHVLEKKAWFRLLKVIYMLGFLLLFVSTLAIFSIHFPEKIVNNTNTTITCHTGNKKTFNAATESFNFVYSPNTPNHVLVTEEDENRFYKLCNMTPPEAFAAAVAESMTGNKPYDIKPSIHMRGATILYWVYFILSLLAIIIVFEAIKRLFYYVFFGKADFSFKKP